MCNECSPHIGSTGHTNRINKRGMYHCLTGKAYYNIYFEKYHWYIDGRFVDVSSQEEFENSKLYREYKLKAFK